MFDLLEKNLAKLFDSLGEVREDNYRWFFFCGLLVGLFDGALGSWAMTSFNGELLFFIGACFSISSILFVGGFVLLSIYTRWQSAFTSAFAGAFGLFTGLCTPILLGWIYTAIDFSAKVVIAILIISLILGLRKYENPRVDRMHPMDLADPGPGP